MDVSSGGSGSESEVKVGPGAGGALGDPDAFYQMLVEQTTEETARYECQICGVSNAGSSGACSWCTHPVVVGDNGEKERGTEVGTGRGGIEGAKWNETREETLAREREEGRSGGVSGGRGGGGGGTGGKEVSFDPKPGNDDGVKPAKKQPKHPTDKSKPSDKPRSEVTRVVVEESKGEDEEEEEVVEKVEKVEKVVVKTVTVKGEDGESVVVEKSADGDEKVTMTGDDGEHVVVETSEAGDETVTVTAADGGDIAEMRGVGQITEVHSASGGEQVTLKGTDGE